MLMNEPCTSFSFFKLRMFARAVDQGFIVKGRRSCFLILKTSVWAILGSLILAGGLGAQAPESLHEGAILATVGERIDSRDGSSRSIIVNQVIGVDLFSDLEGNEGFFSYTRTNESTGNLSYSSSTDTTDYFEEETGNLILTFTTPYSGTFTQTGSYTGTEFATSTEYSGTVTVNGTFHFTPLDPGAPATAPENIPEGSHLTLMGTENDSLEGDLRLARSLLFEGSNTARTADDEIINYTFYRISPDHVLLTFTRSAFTTDSSEEEAGFLVLDFGDNAGRGYSFGSSYRDTFTASATPTTEEGTTTSSGTFRYASGADAATPVVFSDASLEDAVRAALGGLTGPITRTELATLIELTAKDLDISSLEGLQHALNLRYLDLENNAISDLTPLADLILLEQLLLGNNVISDITTLAKLTGLTWLRLDNNPEVGDISALASLTFLGEISLGNTGISDLGALASMPNLQTAWLWRNAISDLSPLAALSSLRSLDLPGNLISDLSPLAGLSALEYLNLRYNQISSISALSGLGNLRDQTDTGFVGLDLRDNNIPTTPGTTDRLIIDNFAAQPDLTVLYFPQNNQISGIIISTNISGRWKVTGVSPAAEWNTSAAFDDTAWENGSFAGSYGASGEGFENTSGLWDASASTEIWLRYRVELPSSPLVANLDLTWSHDGALYINGSEIIAENDGSSNFLTNLDVTSSLVPGLNLIAVRATSDGLNQPYVALNINAVYNRPDSRPESSALATVTVLPDLSGGFDRTEVRDISADARVAVGAVNSSRGNEPYLWTEAGGYSIFPLLPGASASALTSAFFTASAVTPDGSIAVGRSPNPNPDYSTQSVAVSYNAATGELTALPDPFGIRSRAIDISADGSVIVGQVLTSLSPFTSAPAIWRSGESSPQLIDLPNPGGASSVDGWAYHVTPDGTTVSGFVLHDGVIKAFRWRADSGVEFLPGPVADTESEARELSADGSIVAGNIRYTDGSGNFISQAVWWDANGDLQTAPETPAVAFPRFEDVTADGYRFSGYGNAPADSFVSGRPLFIPILFDRSTNQLYLTHDVLTTDYGINANGWFLSASGLSDDGTKLYGMSYFDIGEISLIEGHIIELTNESSPAASLATLSPDAQEATYPVDALPLARYTVSSSAAWLQPAAPVFSGNSGILFSVSANNGADREGTLTLSDGRTLIIRQEGILEPPIITSQTTETTVFEGSLLSLNVTASGDGPFSYTWRQGSTVVSTEGPTFSKNTAAASDAGSYTVEVSGPGGSTTSSPITVEVTIVATGSRALWPESTPVGGDWYDSGWFSYYWDNGSFWPWMYHAHHGWLWVHAATPDSIWLYDPNPQVGWIFTNQSSYPYLYIEALGGPVYFLQEGATPDYRWFYNFFSEEWFLIETEVL